MLTDRCRSSGRVKTVPFRSRRKGTAGTPGLDSFRTGNRHDLVGVFFSNVFDCSRGRLRGTMFTTC